MKTKIKVLIPTDFSVQSDYAYIMVQNLSKKMDLSVTFLHVLSVPDTVSMDQNGNIQTCGEIDVDYVVTQKNVAEKKLKALELMHDGDISTDLVLGKLTTSVLSYAENEQFDLIVMGTKGASGLSERIAGSEAQVVARKSTVPVLTLMCDRSSFDLGSIVLVHNFKETSNQEFALLQDFVDSFGVKVHLLQITSDTSSENKATINGYMDEFASNNGLQSYEKHILHDVDVENGVIHFNQMNNIDMVCIGTHGKGGLFHSSAAEALINHMYKPVITFRLK
jgi:nucleotide-binding universal stress UspA family protein